ncbi:PKD domain-containing protein [Pyxidicoccus caerfyrddinensis]|uniref:PKD domain-containing protein n=1 Tax=Pyxidicoccus caerfyrddinensis TaxID=2709663 RepID=UPI0013DD5F8B|nr:PKD domain-containing protein [Pyxidicoccus caerfyrddinensis]
MSACGGSTPPPAPQPQPPGECTAAQATPVAQAGEGQLVIPGARVALDGSASTAQGYRWTLSTTPNGSHAALSDATVSKPTFTADVPGLYAATLVVSDGCLESLPDTVIVSAETPAPPPPPENLRPVARAGSSLEVLVGLAVEVDGSASTDPEGQTLTYSWTVVSSPHGSTATLSQASAAKPSITPDLEGAYVLRLVVSDGTHQSEPAFITLSGRDTAPVARPGASRAVLSRRPVTLDGSASSASTGGPVTFTWSFVSVPTGSAAAFADAAAVKPTFTPDLEGDYVVALVVSDGMRPSAPTHLTVIAQNRAPVADAGADRSIVAGSSVSVQGQGHDENGDTLTFAWTITRRPNGSTATLQQADTQRPSLALDREGSYELALVVDDGRSASRADTVVITAQAPFVSGLGHRVTDAEYSKALDRLVMVSTNPNALYLYEPATQTETSVALPAAPISLSVGPDGQFAAVGHASSISYVDLATPQLVKTVTVTSEDFDVVLAGNGFAYAFPRSDPSYWVSIHCVDLATGVETLSSDWSLYAGTRARLHPNGTSIYGATNSYYSGEMEKYDISRGTARMLYRAPYNSERGVCGELWFSEDGGRIFTACGNTFRASDVRAEDMTYSGTLSGAGSIRHLTHSTAANRIALVQASYWEPSAGKSVRLYLPDALGFERSIALPAFKANGTAYDGFGRFVFYSAAGDKLIVVVQADPSSGLLNDYGIVTF